MCVLSADPPAVPSHQSGRQNHHGKRIIPVFGTLVRVGVEGTGSYGTGLTRHLQGHGAEVVEVNRPNRQMRRHGASPIRSMPSLPPGPP